MVSKRVADYVAKMLKLGYPLDYIKSKLSQIGYLTQEIEEAVNAAQRPASNLFSSSYLKIWIIGIVLIITASLLLYFLNQKQPESSIKKSETVNSKVPEQATNTTKSAITTITKKQVPKQMPKDLPKEPKSEESLSPFEMLDKIKEIAKSDEEAALAKCEDFDINIFKHDCHSSIAGITQNKEYCKLIQDESIKDECIAKVAKITKNDLICEEILSANTKDNCYLTFFMEFRDYSVCFKLAEPDMKSSCESLRDSRI